MTELRVVVPDEIAERLVERAEREHSTPEQLASEAVRSYVGPAPKSGGRRLSFVGIGHSGTSESIAERHEEIIREFFSDKTARDV